MRGYIHAASMSLVKIVVVIGSVYVWISRGEQRDTTCLPLYVFLIQDPLTSNARCLYKYVEIVYQVKVNA